jgi:hypothetical protein
LPGSSGRLCHRNLDEKEVRGIVRGRVWLADGGIALMRTSCVSLVLAVVTAVHTVDFDAADHHLDSEHYSDLLRLAFASAWAALVGS